MAAIFRFKQFNVDQSGCAMKINTDGVLLGALAEASQPRTILDIGAGTGVIALMLAQRFTGANVDAVEIDESAATTAKMNFADASFANRLTLYFSSSESFLADHPGKKYDLVVSNPPFYINLLVSPGEGKTLAKHADAAFFEQLITAVPAHLTETGAFWLILPLTTAVLVKKLAKAQQLHLQQIILVHSYPASSPHREILVFGLGETKIVETGFVIYDTPKQYAEGYKELLKDFLTIF